MLTLMMFPAAVRTTLVSVTAIGVAAPEGVARTALLLRCALLLGCLLAIGLAVGWGDPSGFLTADPALARLLRGMALIKGLIAMAAVAAVFWRLARPVSWIAGAAYLVGCWALAGATLMIWQLSHIIVAALMFHAAAVALALVSWRDGMPRAVAAR